MDIKVGSRVKCSLTGSEFMVVKTGEGTLSNGGKNLLDSTEKTEISSEFMNFTRVHQGRQYQHHFSQFH